MTPHIKTNQSDGDPLEHFDVSGNHSKDVYKPKTRNYTIIWKHVIFFIIFHFYATYGLYLTLTSAKMATVLFTFINYNLAMFGTTAGAHRLWAHRAYKATWQLKLFLLYCQTLAHQNSIIIWARNHRIHHKYSETDADPHNAKRGFFFSHMGWLLTKQHKDVKEKGKQIDMSDLYEDRLVRLQHEYFFYLMLIFCFVLPTLMPMYLWNENFSNAFFLNCLRYILDLHATWLVNSAAHFWGHKPYDRYINPVENAMVSVFTQGEGWHNYHHTFPWDYKASEFGRINFTLTGINFFAKLGWAYDLKTASKDIIKGRVEAKGDGSHEIWGWGDEDQTKEDYQNAIIENRKSL